MPQIWEQNELINLVNEVLYCDDDFSRLKKAIDNIYTIFSNISHVDVFDMSDNEYDILISETMLACFAKDFYKAFPKSVLASRMLLIVASHMASEEKISGLNCSELNLYTASGWNYDSLEDKNRALKKVYGFSTGKKASEFAAMGYEMGLLFLPMLPILQQDNKQAIFRHIKSSNIDGPRGIRNFHHNLSLAYPTIDIEKITTSNNTTAKIVIDQGVALKYNNSVFEEIHSQSVSGWKNPYLCV